MQSNFQKISKKQLGALLGVSYPTALKEYKYLLQELGLTRTYLTVNEVKIYFKM